MSVDIFAPTADRQSLLGRANAGVTMLMTFALTVALLLVKDWVSAGSIFVLEMLAVAIAGINPLKLLGRFWPVLIGALLSGWSTALLVEKTGTMIFDIGFMSVSTGSLLTGFALALRGLALVVPGLLLLATTDPTHMADSLAQTAKLPSRFVLSALAALRLVGLMASEWNVLGQARRARGLGSHDTLLQRLKTMMGQTFALLVQAIRRGTRLSITMEARGFGSGKKRTWARVPRYSLLDLWFSLAVLAIVAAGYGLAAWTGTLTFLWS